MKERRKLVIIEPKRTQSMKPEVLPMKLLENGRVITRDSANPFFEDGAVCFQDDSIVEVGQREQLREKYPQAELIDAHGGVIMPGIINAHSHLRGIFSKGLCFPGEPRKTYLQVMDGQWWALDRKMKLKDTSAAADCAFISCVENGVTTVFEQHASYGEVPGSLFAVAESARRLGVRSCLSYEISDREGERKMKQALKENVEYINSLNDCEDDSAAAMLGLHAQFTLSDATLDYCAARKPAQAGFCVHVAEAALDVTESLNKHGIRPVFRLYDFGIFGRNTIFSDCTHISEREMEVIKSSDTMVVHSPESNIASAAGYPPVLKLMEKGILAGLGAGGYTRDMLESLKTASLLCKHELNDASAAEEEIPRLLFDGNAKIAERFFKRPIGVLKRGAHADIIVSDYVPATPMTAENIDRHLLFGMSGAMTRTTIIGGRLRMKDREVIGIDKQEVLAHARETVQELQKRISKK